VTKHVAEYETNNKCDLNERYLLQDSVREDGIELNMKSCNTYRNVALGGIQSRFARISKKIWQLVVYDASGLLISVGCTCESTCDLFNRGW
jgi:hypothetical protein